MLDIGAGDGDMDYPIRIRPYASRIVGVDPSPGIHDNHLVDERHESTLEEVADQFVATFDIAVASYVVEHVAEPERFLRAVATVLKPGGSCFLLTPHAGHYFGAIALATERIGIEEWLLHRIRSHDVLHDHHFPVAYRLNTRKKLMRQAAAAGFVSVEVRMIEDPGIFQPYFPAALRGLPRGVFAAGAPPRPARPRRHDPLPSPARLSAATHRSAASALHWHSTALSARPVAADGEE